MTRKPKPQPHTAAIGAALTTLTGLAGVAVTNPPTTKPGWALFGLTAIGSLFQAITKGVQQGGTDLVAKPPF